MVGLFPHSKLVVKALGSNPVVPHHNFVTFMNNIPSMVTATHLDAATDSSSIFCYILFLFFFTNMTVALTISPMLMSLSETEGMRSWMQAAEIPM